MKEGDPCISLTNRDERYITKAIDIAASHHSGGSYNMVALWVKGSNVITGMNCLFRQASTHSDAYSDMCGFHAELDLFRRTNGEMKGGTIYIAGRKEANNAIMMNTKPCLACQFILRKTKTKWIVYLANRCFTKVNLVEL